MAKTKLQKQETIHANAQKSFDNSFNNTKLLKLDYTRSNGSNAYTGILTFDRARTSIGTFLRSIQNLDDSLRVMNISADKALKLFSYDIPVSYDDYSPLQDFEKSLVQDCFYKIKSVCNVINFTDPDDSKSALVHLDFVKGFMTYGKLSSWVTIGVLGPGYEALVEKLAYVLNEKQKEVK